jgi:hypothetical protein
MSKIIEAQNIGIVNGTLNYPGQQPQTNQQLATILNIDAPPDDYQQDYKESDIKVTVI